MASHEINMVGIKAQANALAELVNIERGNLDADGDVGELQKGMLTSIGNFARTLSDFLAAYAAYARAGHFATPPTGLPTSTSLLGAMNNAESDQSAVENKILALIENGEGLPVEWKNLLTAYKGMTYNHMHLGLLIRSIITE